MKGDLSHEQLYIYVWGYFVFVGITRLLTFLRGRTLDYENERREHARIEVKWPITLFTNNDTIEGELQNITVKGVYIFCEKPLPLNTVFRMSILPPSHQSIGVSGKVVWSDLYGIDDDKDVYGMGICLLEISDEDRDFINDLVSTYLK